MTFRYTNGDSELVVNGREERVATRLNRGAELVMGSLTPAATGYLDRLLQAQEFAEAQLAPEVATLDAMVLLARQRDAGDLPVFVSMANRSRAVTAQMFRKDTIEGERVLVIDLDRSAP